MKKLIYDQSDAGKQEFAAVLEQYEFNSNVPTNIKIGTKVTGNLVQKNNKFATIEFGGKSSITVYNTNSEKYIIENLKIGQEVSVLIKDIIDKDNFEYIGSLYDLNMQKINLFLLEAVKTNLILTGKVIELLHSGYNILVNINDSEVTLFMPHLLTDVNKLSDPESILNTDIDFCIESINIKGKISYIASRKKYLMSLIPNELKKLKRGMYCVGTVTGTADFAVFVQFNNVLTGMIHKSNLIQEYKDKLQDIKPGDSISFYIKDILKQGTKINLFLTQEIKESLQDNIKVNDILEGKIVAIKDFGVMVGLDFETKGLLHKSVLSRNLSEYKLGTNVTVVVTNVNKNNRQITLALK